MKFRKILPMILIVLIIAVNTLTVCLFLSQKSDGEYIRNGDFFGTPSEIICHDGEESKVLSDKDSVMNALEKSHRYVYAFSQAEVFDTESTVWLELVYDEPHPFSDGYTSIMADKIKIDLFYNSGSMIIESDGTQTGLGYLNINSVLLNTIHES